MSLARSSVWRGVASLLGACALGTLIAGCSGGSTSSAIPATSNVPQAAAPASTQPLAVERAMAGQVLAKVSNAVAYYMPMTGQKPRLLQLSGRQPLTSAAGNDLSYFGGPTQHGAAQYNILVNATSEAPWGVRSANSSKTSSAARCSPSSISTTPAEPTRSAAMSRSRTAPCFH